MLEQLTPDERRAWNAAVMLHAEVQKVRALCEAAGLDGDAITAELRAASDAAFRLFRTIEGKT